MATFGRKVTVIQHWHHHLPSPSTVKNAVRKLLWRKSYFVGVSESVTDGLKQLFPKKSFTVENAINYSRLDTYENSCEIDAADSTKCLLFGYNWYVKGVDVAVKAIDKLNKAGYRVDLYVSLSANKDVLMSKVREWINASGLPEWLHLLTARNDVATFYHAADVFLATSRQEGFCYSVVEAAYCGCPIIASKIPAQEDLQVPNTTWFESENVDGLAEAIKQRIGLKASLTEEQKNAIVSRYSLTNWGHNMVNIYNQLAGK